jgi:hypothetical protein
MARPRFATAREMVEAFPTARYHVRAKPADQPPVAFIESLVAARAFRDAVSSCAYLLPRREAVWWACQCLRATGKVLTGREQAALEAAEKWVKMPEEELRRAALDLGADGDPDSAAVWACRAAGWSGGTVGTGPKGPVRARPEATAGAVRAAVLIAATYVKLDQQEACLKSFVDDALRLVQRDGESS